MGNNVLLFCANLSSYRYPFTRNLGISSCFPLAVQLRAGYHSIAGNNPSTSLIICTHGPLITRVKTCLIMLFWTEFRHVCGELLPCHLHQLRSRNSENQGSFEIWPYSNYSSNRPHHRRGHWSNTKNRDRSIYSNMHPSSSGCRNVLRGVWRQWEP